MVQQHSTPTSSHVDLGEDITKDEDDTFDTAVVGDLIQTDIVNYAQEEVALDTEEKKQSLGIESKGDGSNTPDQLVFSPKNVAHQVEGVLDTPTCGTPANTDSQVSQLVAPGAHSLEHLRTFEHDILTFLDPPAVIHLTEKVRQSSSFHLLKEK